MIFNATIVPSDIIPMSFAVASLSRLISHSSYKILNRDLDFHISNHDHTKKRQKHFASAVSINSDCAFGVLCQCDVELFLMNSRVALDGHDTAQICLDLCQHIAFGAAQGFDHFGIDAEDDFVVILDIF